MEQIGLYRVKQPVQMYFQASLPCQRPKPAQGMRITTECRRITLNKFNLIIAPLLFQKYYLTL